ncbi:hypothetical protein [Methylosinus trichosporium]|uniref:hypothetical protein n=1 Tax=Methylosinus trichosporium TaxID=426 RepID=UPI0024B9AF20|nr:hypothetical protein [Methylosinus trichosporium]
MGRRRRHRHHERTSERLGLLAAALDYWPSRRMPIAMRLALAVVIGNAFVLAGVLLVDAKPRVAEPPSAPPPKWWSKPRSSPMTRRATASRRPAM